LLFNIGLGACVIHFWNIFLSHYVAVIKSIEEGDGDDDRFI